MVKYALIIAFSYPKAPYSNYELTKLTCTADDIRMIHSLSKKVGIPDNNITIITDLLKLPSEVYNSNIKNNPFPDDIFVCRELSQFIENTIRGIEEEVYKSDDSPPEILLYISGHGGEININGKNEQSIILTSDGGYSLKYLLSKDLFNIIFGNLPIDESGKIDIPIYSKVERIRRVDTQTQKMSVIEYFGELSYITVNLPAPINSPQNSPSIIVKPYRSSYLANRGIPFYSKLLAIIDTCYSAHMTQFPYKYDTRSQIMIQSPAFNIDVNVDLPYCVAISSCESNKTSKFKSSGSALTTVLYLNLSKYKGRLNISQLHYLIYNNTSNNIINNLLRTQSTSPIITSTSTSTEQDIPFFTNYIPKNIQVIIK